MLSISLLLGALALSPAAASAAPETCSARDEAFLPIGGIEQWVTISGDSCGNPVILFVHGGPGNPLSPYSKSLYGSWEKDFTIVQWDQRAAGRTFARNPASAEAPLTIAQLTSDGVEVADYLNRRFNRKIILVGGSWGSVLGVHMAKARPDLFSAYVGVGQLVSYRDNPAASYRRVIELTRAAGDNDNLAKIEAIGPPPWSNPRNFGILRRVTRTYEAKTTGPAPDNWWKPAPAYATPDYAAAYEAGEEHSYLQFVGLNGDGMLSKVDLPSLGTDFAIPVYLIQGSQDLVTVPQVAKAYFDMISAPQKLFVSVDAAGHDPNPALLDALRSTLVSASRLRPESPPRGN